MDLTIEEYSGKSLVTILCVKGKLEGMNSTDVVDKVTELFSSKKTNLVLDMKMCEGISTAGILTLLKVSLISCGGHPSDHENGWDALREMRDKIEDGIDVCFKIANLQPKVKQAIVDMGMLESLDVYDNLEMAFASF